MAGETKEVSRWKKISAGTAVAAILAAAVFADMRSDFVNPPLTYKTRPLYFWNNTTVTAATVQTQMQRLRDSCGYGGFGILPFGSGFLPAYLSASYFTLYGAAVTKAAELGQKLCIYDEYGFPSGSAGAINGDGTPRFRNAYPNDCIKRLDKAEEVIVGPRTYTRAAPAGTLMAVVAMDTATKTRVDLTSTVTGGSLTWSAPAGVWRVMFFVCVLDGDPNVDYLDSAAVDKFTGMVHQAYYTRFQSSFGTTIDGIFYDEPTMYRAAGRMWTTAYNQKFQAKYGFSPAQYYPALWYDIGAQTQAARNYLFGFRSELYAAGFMKRSQDWADSHGGIPVTGHQDQEDVKNPVSVSGDLMKCYKYQAIPGIDMIGYNRNAGTEKFYKIVSSVAYNWDRRLVMSETYGAMGNLSWNEIYAIAMEQYAKGINDLIPHAVWYDNGNVTFLPELSYRNSLYAAGLPGYNTYMGRCNVLLQQWARHIADISVLYPIATLQGSHYLDGPLGYYAGGVDVPEADYVDVGEILSTNISRDYTWLHPEILDGRCSVAGAELRLQNTVNTETYKVMVVPGHKTICWSNLQKIKQFYDNGGKVIATGTLPSKAAEFGHDADVANTIAAMFPGGGSGITITASSQWAAGGYEPSKATDGDTNTRWNAADNSGGGQWLEVDFGGNRTFNKTITREIFDRITSYTIQYWNGSAWTTCASGTTAGAAKTDLFGQVTSSRIRLYVNTITTASVSIREFEVYLNNGPNLAVADSLAFGTNVNGGKAVFIRTPTAGILRDVLDSMESVYDVEFENNRPLRYIHKVKDTQNIYFFANTTNAAVDAYALLRNGGVPEAWDPHTGTIIVPQYSQNAGVTRVHLNLAAYRSVFIVSRVVSTGAAAGPGRSGGIDKMHLHVTAAVHGGIVIRTTLPAHDGKPTPEHLSRFNVRGCLVSELVNSPQLPGDHTVRWSGEKSAPGCFIVRLKACGNSVLTEKVIRRN